MALGVGDAVTVRKDARRPLILEYQYHATIQRRTDLGYYVATGNAIEPATGKQLEFGPFLPEQLLPGWTDENGRPRL